MLQIWKTNFIVLTKNTHYTSFYYPVLLECSYPVFSFYFLNSREQNTVIIAPTIAEIIAIQKSRVNCFLSAFDSSIIFTPAPVINSHPDSQILLIVGTQAKDEIFVLQRYIFFLFICPNREKLLILLKIIEYGSRRNL